MLLLHNKRMQSNWLLGPHSHTWKIVRERALLIGGGRALMLQAGHPLVGAGIHQHSGYQSDPWSRLKRTSDFYLSLVYAREQDLVSLNKWLEHAHRGVQGQADGRSYSASDPDLMLWVQATLADSIMWSWSQLWGMPPQAHLQAFWQEQVRLGEAINIKMDNLPSTWEGFQAWMQAQQQDLQATPAACSLLGHLQDLPIAMPGIPPLAWQTGAPLGRRVSSLALSAGLRPEMRERLGLEYGPSEQQRWEAYCRRIRWALKLTPAPIKHSKHARRAIKKYAQESSLVD